MSQSVHPDVVKAVFVLALLKRRPESRPRDMAISTVLAVNASRFGPGILPYLTTASFLVEDEYERLSALGLLSMEDQVDALLRTSQQMYDDFQKKSPSATRARESLMEILEALEQENQGGSHDG